MHRLLALLLVPCVSFGALCAKEVPRVIGQVFVQRDGRVRVEAAALEALGAPSPAHVEVRRHGNPVPSWVEDGALHFDALDTASAHTVHAAYRFWRRAEPVVAAKPVADAGPLTRYVLDGNRFYGALASARHEVYGHPAPVWYLARILRGKTAEFPLAPKDLDAASQMTLTAEIRTAHLGTVALTARWGEADLGVARTTGNAARGATLTWTVPAGSAPREAAALRLSDVSPPIPAAPARDISAGRDTVWVDSVALSGPPSKTRGEPRARRVEPTRLTRIPDPLAAAGSARHVVIAVPALIDEAKRLAEHRTATGTPSAVVPVTGIYDRYGHGEHTPQAIRAFVLDLMARKDAPLEYLLLAGDATLDRTDIAAEPTIPTLMARSIYNGATAADPLYVVASNGEMKGSPPIGRLPFRASTSLRDYVDRLIRYETKPPAHASRRMFRFITSEARFGRIIDGMIEQKFRSILTKHIAPEFDIEGTYASETSPFLWPPPEFNEKVLAGLNEGSLFFTYVGHGFAEGFDTLRVGSDRYPILHIDDVDRVAVEGTHPIMFVLACTTAQFDGLSDGVGEALMRRPQGPIAFWGASRICHPAFNAMMGQAIAMHMARPAGTRGRLGPILAAARDDVLAGRVLSGTEKLALRMFLGGAKLDHLAIEGTLMYTLFGDPALKVAFPQEGVAVRAEVGSGEVLVSISASLPDETIMHVSLELPRNRNAGDPKPVENPGEATSFPAIRAKHARMNDWALVRTDVALKAGKAQVRLPLGAEDAKGLVVKAWCIAEDDVHQGASVLP